MINLSEFEKKKEKKKKEKKKRKEKKKPDSSKWRSALGGTFSASEYKS